jgi:hypothetical protein
MRMSKTFVLIHGAWHGGWAWKDVIRRLSEKGYGAHTHRRLPDMVQGRRVWLMRYIRNYNKTATPIRWIYKDVDHRIAPAAI